MINSAFKNQHQTWDTRVYFEEHTMLFSEEEMLLFLSIFYLLTHVWAGSKGGSGWREKDSRQRSSQEIRQLKFPEPERNIDVKAKVAAVKSKFDRKAKTSYIQVEDPGYEVLVKGLMQKTATEFTSLKAHCALLCWDRMGKRQEGMWRDGVRGG